MTIRTLGVMIVKNIMELYIDLNQYRNNETSCTIN